MNVYEKPNAEMISFESESIMDGEGQVGGNFSSVEEGLIDLGSL